MPFELPALVKLESERLELVGGGPLVFVQEMALDDDDYRRFGRHPNSMTAEEVEEASEELEAKNRARRWAVILKNDQRPPVGLIELYLADPTGPTAEAGCFIGQPWRGQGLATKAL